MIRLLGKKSVRVLAACALGAATVAVFAQEKPGPQQPWSKWKVHDMTRPTPPIVSPGTSGTANEPGKPPSDAIVLFDGKDLSHWQSPDGSEPTFTLQDGVMLSTNVKTPRNTKNLQSKEKFGDVQLHLEWAEPTPPKGDSQGRGNSGVFLFGKFETQVLDSYNNRTYADGQCGGIYGQYPPQVNASRPPGEWQTYDIIFHRPRYENGKLVHKARITTIQNGVLMQDSQEIEGPTGHMIVAKYPASMPEKGPLELQFHGNPVRYRNIWVRPLEALEQFQHTGEHPKAIDNPTDFKGTEEAH